MTDFATRRTLMVDGQVRPADVTRFPVIEAMLHVPRERFVPPESREAAYLGENLALAPGRVLLDPRSTGKLLDALELRPGERVLDVGAGLGYVAALLDRMGARVTALEERPDLAARARAALAAEHGGVEIVVGPLAAGAPDRAPFDAMLIEGAVEDLPEALLAQLAEDGRIAAIFAEGALGTARLGRREAGRVHWRYAFNAGAPVLPGFERRREFVL
jgi:protein-L-isoaspartate(D-aspartate) O-methyltransferase